MSSRSAADAAARHRAGTAAIVGRPNVGKSTLLNRLVGSKISITSNKPQTTRQRITGIVTHPAGQVAFIDTPGYQIRHRSALNQAMNRGVAASLKEADAIIWVVEALKFDERDEIVAKLLPRGVPVILAINKTDALKDKGGLLPFISKLSTLREFAAIIPVSAERGTQLDELLGEILRLMPEGPPFHDADEMTTASERFLAAEALREKLFRLLGDELPYATAVEIEHFRQEGGLRHIQASILVDKEGQKPIVIGTGGSKLKAIASGARRDLERLFGGKVFLEVRVKVRSGWADSAGMLKRMGFDS